MRTIRLQQLMVLARTGAQAQHWTALDWQGTSEHAAATRIEQSAVCPLWPACFSLCSFLPVRLGPAGMRTSGEWLLQQSRRAL